MANITGLYNPEAEAQQDNSPLPTGEYTVQIVDSDLKPTKNNAGHYLELTFEVLDGPQKGRKHWERLNLDNPNAQAVEIANRTFSAIREATGVLTPRTSEELHFRPLGIRVESYPAGSARKNGHIRERDESDVKAYRKVEGGLGNVQAPPAPAAASPTTTSPSSAPWSKRAA
jgi:hypothetical protein